MKIDNSVTNIKEQLPSEPAGPARPSSEGAATVAAGRAVDSGAKVELSSTATGLLSSAQSVPGEFDTLKVERLAMAIIDGKFTVNAEVIADKLIANAQELLGNVTR